MKHEGYGYDSYNINGAVQGCQIPVMTKFFDSNNLSISVNVILLQVM